MSRSPASARTAKAAPAGGIASLLPTLDQRARDRILFGFFLTQALALTVLQKFGYGAGDNMIAIVVPIMAAGLAVTALLVRPVVSLPRIGLYLLFVAAAVGSTGLFAVRYSVSSLALLVILYLPFLFAFPISDAGYRRCMDAFVTIMLIVAGIVFAQHAVQILLSAKYWPNLSTLPPAQYVIPNFIYLQPIRYGSALMKPNAVFFLEPSFLSQYFAIAIAIEVTLFQRPLRLVLLAAGLFASFAGTGLLLLAITLPVLLGRMKPRNMALVVVALLVVLLVAVRVGWFDIVSLRLDEYSHVGSSANHRFVEPIERMLSATDLPRALYSGIGAGQIEKSLNFQFWPIAKLVVEYGYITAALFYAFLIYAMLDHAPSRRIAFTLLIWFSLEGSLLTPLNPLLCALLSSLFVIRRERRTGDGGARRRRSRAATA